MSAAAGGSAPEERAAGVAGGAGLFRRLRTTPLRDVLRGELTSRLDLPLTIERSGLPAELGAVVGEVTRRTRLWRAERIDVARELIAHFQDGLAAGREPAALAEAFGPPAEAARLIRRAKRRGRPLWWHAQRRMWQGLGIAVAGYAALVAWYWQGTPTVRRDYLAELTAPIKAMPMEERAWPEYRAALLEIYPAHRRWLEMFKTDFMALKPGDAEWPRFAEEMRALGPALARVREASAKPGLGFVPALDLPEDPEFERAKDPDWKPAGAVAARPSGMLSWVLLPQLGPLRTLTRTLARDAQLAATEGAGGRVVEDVRALLAIGRQAAEFPCLITELVELSVIADTVDRVGWIVEHAPGSLSDEHLLVLTHALAAVRGGGPLQVSARGLAGEWAMLDDALQRMYTDDGRGDGVITVEGLRLMSVTTETTDFSQRAASLAEIAFTPVASYLMMSRRANAEGAAAVRAGFEAWMAERPWEQKAMPAPEDLAGLPKASWRQRFVPVVWLVPSLSRVPIAGYRVTMQRDGVLVALAAELFKRREGRYPERLAEMVPRYLPAVPVDLFDGKPLRYVVRDGRPLVYSVGHDRVDDGGRVNVGWEGEQKAAEWRFVEQPVDKDKTGDWVLYPEPKAPPREPGPGAG